MPNKILPFIDNLIKEYSLKYKKKPKQLYLSNVLFNQYHNAITNEYNIVKDFIKKSQYKNIWITRLDKTTNDCFIIGE